ncbi:MAG: class I tRNA ligase family protein [Anaerolineales bacterium]|nr:class I tRNA ligase family protein [Anaerolineales bacterium]
MLHPFMPFVTEAIWQGVPGMAGDARSIMVAPLALRRVGNTEPLRKINSARLRNDRSIRNVRSEYGPCRNDASPRTSA